MQSIKLQSHVGSDGILKLEIPLGLTDADLEVLVVVQPLLVSSPATPEELGWPPGFFEETAGAWQGEPLIREAQGDYEIRDELL
ncbi:MAG: hypothetical protein DPW09_41645 [Anaerolineae bacterium]|nr:hypothetical protein [Anaerolineae bacterium]